MRQANIEYEVYEDNAGGLHLAVFDQGECIYLMTGYERMRQGSLVKDLKALESGANPIADGWEPMRDCWGELIDVELWLLSLRENYDPILTLPTAKAGDSCFAEISRLPHTRLPVLRSLHKR